MSTRRSSLASLRIGFITAGAALAVSAGVLVGPTASAVPYVTEDRWEDCGETICTVYWSKSKTAEIYANSQDPFAVAGRDANYVAGELLPFVDNSGVEAFDTLKATAAVAADRGACLQYAYRKDGLGTPQWDYTTHSDYCWDTSDFEF